MLSLKKVNAFLYRTPDEDGAPKCDEQFYISGTVRVKSEVRRL